MNFVVERFIDYFWAHPAQTSVNVLLSMTFPVDDFLIPYFTGQIVTAVQKRKPWKTPLVSLVALMVAMQVFFSLASWHDAIVIPSMQNHIRHEMVADLLEEFHQSEREPVIGEVMSRLVKIPLTVTCMFEQIKNYLVPYLLSFVLTSLYVMRHDTTMGFVVLGVILAVFALVLFSPLRCLEVTTEQDVALSTVDEQTEDMIRNLTTVYASNQVPQELTRLARYEQRYADSYVKTMSCIMRTRVVAVVLMAFLISYVGYTCYTKTLRNKMTAGTCIAILMIVVQWFGTLGWVVGNCRDIVVDWGILAAYERLKHEEHAREPRDLRRDAPVHTVPQHGIFFDRVTFEVATRHARILDGLTLHVRRGERVAFIGDIGAGKSTLLKLLLRLSAPTAGEIYIDGIPTSSMALSTLRHMIGFVPQHPLLFNRSILENITYGLEEVDRGYVEHLIESLGLTDAFNNLQGGLDAPAGKHGSALSGGQKQLVACMRAILVNPEIIALDEVTSSIDVQTKSKLMSVLDRLFYGKTVLLVTHDMDLLSLVDTVYEIGGGKATVTTR